MGAPPRMPSPVRTAATHRYTTRAYAKASITTGNPPYRGLATQTSKVENGDKRAEIDG